MQPWITAIRPRRRVQASQAAVNSIDGSVFGKVAGQTRRRALRVAQDLDPVDPVAPAAHVARPARSDHGHVPAGGRERPRLLPGPTIHRDRQVLDEDDDAGRARRPSRREAEPTTS